MAKMWRRLPAKTRLRRVDEQAIYVLEKYLSLKRQIDIMFWHILARNGLQSPYFIYCCRQSHKISHLATRSNISHAKKLAHLQIHGYYIGQAEVREKSYGLLRKAAEFVR
jgi:hypothetical protein